VNHFNIAIIRCCVFGKAIITLTAIVTSLAAIQRIVPISQPIISNHRQPSKAWSMLSPTATTLPHTSWKGDCCAAPVWILRGIHTCRTTRCFGNTFRVPASSRVDVRIVESTCCNLDENVIVADCWNWSIRTILQLVHSAVTGKHNGAHLVWDHFD